MNNSKKRILIVTPKYAPTLGGVQIQAAQFANGMKSLGWKTSIITKTVRNTPKSEILNGVSIYRHSLGIIGLTAGLIKLRKSYEIIFFMGYYNNILLQFIVGKILQMTLSKKVAVRFSHEHRSISLRFKLAQMLFKSFDAFYPISNDIKRYFKEDLKIVDSKVHSPPFNIIDTDKFNIPSKKEKIKYKKALNLPLDKKILTFVGRVDPIKNIEGLLRVYKNLIKSKDIHLVLGLSTSYNESYSIKISKNLAKLPKGSYSVIWNYAEQSHIFKCTDYFVLPSFSEGKSTALLEAMASGIPVVCSDLPSSRESLTADLHKYMFNPSNSADFYAKLRNILEKEFTHQDSIMIRKKILKQYSKQSVLNKYDRAFLKMSNKG